MNAERRSKRLLNATRAKAKMFEYSVPEEHHLELPKDPACLMPLAIGLVGDLSRAIASELEVEVIDLLKSQSFFSPQFFDTYIQAHLNAGIDVYSRIISSAGYYLTGMPGHSKVLAMDLPADIDLKAAGIEILLAWLLKSPISKIPAFHSSIYTRKLDDIARLFVEFVKEGTRADELKDALKDLSRLSYGYGTPRELLFADIAAALVLTKMDNSVWHCLPKATSVSIDVWSTIFKKPSFVRELWPSQKILADMKVFDGASSVIQMPTSTGKTKSVEIIIRSAFLKRGVKIAVVISPFRALCHEIKSSLEYSFSGENILVTELSDVMQTDYSTDGINGEGGASVIVVTPEKLVYVLRHDQELAAKIGLLVLDEGHQFDSGIRGVTYELMITTLKRLVPDGAQWVVISAVISNANAINKWINGDDGVVAKWDGLSATNRAVAFSSWKTTKGQIQYVQHPRVERDDFFVPRVIEENPLTRRKGDKKIRVFPDRMNGKSVASYLGVKLAKKGSVAVFCGLKTTAASICELIWETYSRGYTQEPPLNYSDELQIAALARLYARHLGVDSPEAKCAPLGILTHHAGIPHGLRLCVEHAVRERHAHFVVCTSTLAQGVNLPIRYLIFTSIYQAGERLKVRDFHNLIGRAGRAGMYTEGSVLFADPEVFDKKGDRRLGWRWRQIKHLIDPKNSEPCVSFLLSFFDPIKSFDGKKKIDLPVINKMFWTLSDEKSLDSLIKFQLEGQSPKDFDYDHIRFQMINKRRIVSSLESYLMTFLSEVEVGDRGNMVKDLALETFAYALADEKTKEAIETLFYLVAEKIELAGIPPGKERVFGKTLLGIDVLNQMEQWIYANNLKILEAANDDSLLFDIFWPLIDAFITNSDFRKCSPPEARKAMAQDWLAGKAFIEILGNLEKSGARMSAKSQVRNVKIQNVVEMCESGLAYDGMLIVGALYELLKSTSVELNPKPDFMFGDGVLNFSDTTIPDSLKKFQRQFRHGLNTKTSVTLYEAGFRDRVLAQELAKTTMLTVDGNAKKIIRENEEQFAKVLKSYPEYFLRVFSDIISEKV